jgi:hypothetical protein
MALMHYSSTYGYLLVNGKKADLNFTARQLLWHPRTFKTAIAELLSKGVLEQDELGIYSPKMVSDWQKRKQGIEDGKKGGNPKLKDRGVNPPSNVPPVNPETEREKEKETEKEGEPLTPTPALRRFIDHWCQQIGPLVLSPETSCALGDLYRNFERELPEGAKPAVEILCAEIDELCKRPPTKRNLKYFESMLWGKLNET